MAKILDFIAFRHQRMLDLIELQRHQKIELLIQSLGGLQEKADDIEKDFLDLALANPDVVVEELPSFLDRVRNINPGGKAYEAFTGGPNHDWTAPMLNILGLVYPDLSREKRELGLRRCLDFLDSLNYFNSQDNVALVQEPWLAGDIILSRRLYWPGYKGYTQLSIENPKWADFLAKAESVRSPFWLAMAVVRPKYTSLEVRKKFYGAYPHLIDRTMDVIAGIVEQESRIDSKTNNIALEECIENQLSGYDPLLHNSIRTKMDEKKWIVLER